METLGARVLGRDILSEAIALVPIRDSLLETAQEAVIVLYKGVHR